MAEKAVAGRAIRQVARATPVALRQFGQCEKTAGKILPAFWAQAEADSVTLQPLMAASSEVRDRRIEQALMTVAANPSKPLIVRAAAVSVLESYVNPHRRGSVHTSSFPNTPLEIAVGYVDHPQQKEGVEPVGSGFFNRFENLLQQIERSEPSVGPVSRVFLHSQAVAALAALRKRM